MHEPQVYSSRADRPICSLNLPSSALNSGGTHSSTLIALQQCYILYAYSGLLDGDSRPEGELHPALSVLHHNLIGLVVSVPNSLHTTTTYNTHLLSCLALFYALIPSTTSTARHSTIFTSRSPRRPPPTSAPSLLRRWITPFRRRRLLRLLRTCQWRSQYVASHVTQDVTLRLVHRWRSIPKYSRLAPPSRLFPLRLR